MKSFINKAAKMMVLLLSGTVLFSFSANKGGDALEIYVNGKQMLQQFIHMDKSVKTLQLGQVAANDKVEVYYSHCGQVGKSRVLTVKDEKNNVLKHFKFADATGKRSAMSFAVKDVKNNGVSSLKLYYTSNEIPSGKLLAVLSVDDERTARK